MLAVSADPKLALAHPQEFLDLFTRFFKTDVGGGNAADDTRKTYRSNLKQYLAWCASLNLHPLAATRGDLKQYRHWLVEERGYQCTTVALKLSVVRRFYDALIEQGYLVANPVLGVKPPYEKRDPAERINYLQPDEMYRLLQSLPDDHSVQGLRDRLVVAVMVVEGCRTIEMHRATVGDIVRRGSDVGLRVSGKRSIRIVPLTPDLAKLLARYLKAREKAGESLTPQTPLLVSVANGTKGAQLSRRSIGRIVDKYLVANQMKPSPQQRKEEREKKAVKEKKAQKTGTSKLSTRSRSKVQQNRRALSAHSLRHTAGTLALRAGGSLRQVQDLLGHADPRTTALYAHVADRWRNNPALLLDCPAL